MECWRKLGCPFNSNNSWKYMKCWQEDYSVDQCKKDNVANGKWNICEATEEEFNSWPQWKQDYYKSF
jgi:hypothetical protein